MFKKSIAGVILFLLLVFCVNFNAKSEDNITTSNIAAPNVLPFPADVTQYKEVSPLTLVEQPSRYLNKKVKLTATFDKFTAIGLDYPPVNRDAKNYISFLIKRENVTAYNIPLSELKLIVKRNYAEKELVNVEQGDSMIIYGTVFSAALGDPWVDVERINLKANKTKSTNK